MAPKELEGSTLGEKHRHFNNSVRQALASHAPWKSHDLNTGENDVENLMSIDVSCKRRDVDYVLQVLKCEDMLYVSRVIKLSKWLITDRQYSHIINPNYLNKELLPQMISKASTKFMLHIRLNLKDEQRVEEFYNYYKDKDIKTAMKWLPHCSLPLIEKEVEKHYQEIHSRFLKRLCERSITVFEKFVKVCNYPRSEIKNCMFLISTDCEKFLDILETVPRYQTPSFGPTYTEKLMKLCPQRIKDKFDIYAEKVDIDVFAKHLKKDDIKDFLITQSKSKKMERWFSNFNNVKHFVEQMPLEGRFEFLKQFFIEKTHNDSVPTEGAVKCRDVYYCSSSAWAPAEASTNANIYRWYYFAPFEVAFSELTKLIRNESSPSERISMFAVLISCAGRNPNHLQTLIQYYHDKHINEPFKFKIQFVNMLLSKTVVHKYDEISWNLLNDIFHSMEVYIESNNKVPSCIEAIIVYKLVHDQSVPEIIESKFTFNSLISYAKKLKEEDSNKVFNYLYQLQISKIDNKKIVSQNDFEEAVGLLETCLTLLVDWMRNIESYPWVQGKIKEYIKLKNDNAWKVDLSGIYNKNKSWRRNMFEESLELFPSDETCYNALKHDPTLLSRYQARIDELRRNEDDPLCRVLRTLRVYWPQSLAEDWKSTYLLNLEQTSGHKTSIRSLCILMPPKQITEMIMKYAPKESKINWNEDDEVILSLRKQFGKNMYLSRPHPTLDVVLLYAKGDYLQFALPSLTAMLYNMTSVRIYDNITTLLDSPVSLQKHGIRFAFSKLDSDKLKTVFYKIWKHTKNPSIRAVLFKQTYELLCREKNNSAIKEVWDLLSMFIDNLSCDENKIVYVTLGKVDKVPLLVRGKFLMKSYNFLKSLPAKVNCEGILCDVKYKVADLMEDLDPEFVVALLSENLDKNFTTKSYDDKEIIAVYLLCSKEENDQENKFKRLLHPLLERSFALWNVKHDDVYWVSRNVIDFLKQLAKYLQKYVLEKKMIFPIKLFADILDLLEKRLPIESSYMTIRTWKLIVTFLKVLEEYKDDLNNVKESDDQDYYNPSSNEKWNGIYLKAVPKFAEICSAYLKEDIKNFFPSIYVLFADAFKAVFTDNIHDTILLECLNTILNIDQSVEANLMVLQNISPFYAQDEDARKKIKEICNTIHSHQSTEVKFHYYRKFKHHEEME